MLTGAKFFPQGCCPIVSNHSWSESNSSLLLQKPPLIPLSQTALYYTYIHIIYMYIYTLSYIYRPIASCWAPMGFPGPICDKVGESSFICHKVWKFAD